MHDALIFNITGGMHDGWGEPQAAAHENDSSVHIRGDGIGHCNLWAHIFPTGSLQSSYHDRIAIYCSVHVFLISTLRGESKVGQSLPGALYQVSQRYKYRTNERYVSDHHQPTPQIHRITILPELHHEFLLEELSCLARTGPRRDRQRPRCYS